MGGSDRGCLGVQCGDPASDVAKFRLDGSGSEPASLQLAGERVLDADGLRVERPGSGVGAPTCCLSGTDPPSASPLACDGVLGQGLAGCQDEPLEEARVPCGI